MLYFAVVFGVGFALGPIRVLWAVPRFGVRTAELLELPLMLLITIVAARRLTRARGAPSTALGRLGMGGLALTLLLLAEFGVVLPLRGLSLREYLAHRDPVSGACYYALLGVYAVMPFLVGRRRAPSGEAPTTDPGHPCLTSKGSGHTEVG